VDSLPAHQAELERYLEEQTPSPRGICVQETWLNKNKSFVLKGYDVERRDRQNRQGGGVEIFVCQELEWNPPNVVTSMECMAVQIIARPTPITICNIYCAEQLIDEKTS
jgi:exonuclease III